MKKVHLFEVSYRNKIAPKRAKVAHKQFLFALSKPNAIEIGLTNLDKDLREEFINIDAYELCERDAIQHYDTDVELSVYKVRFRDGNDRPLEDFYLASFTKPLAIIKASRLVNPNTLDKRYSIDAEFICKVSDIINHVD